MRNLAFLRCHGGERRNFLDHPLATAVWTNDDGFLAIGDVQNLGKLLLAILAEEKIVWHSSLLESY